MPTLSLVENAATHLRELGKFVVVKKGTRKEFDTLVKAFKYYSKLNTDATLYDVTVNEEMLEKKIMLKHKYGYRDKKNVG